MENIARLMAELPNDYEDDCFTEGALTRRRGVNNPADLMMLSMFHLQNGCTLIEISEIARITKLGEMSDVAFMKRFEKCGNWFRTINSKIATNGIIKYQKPNWLEDKTIVAVDASDVTEKGRSGRTYRLHFAFDVFNMGSVDYSITDVKVGESLVNFNIKPGHLVIGDRAYSTINGIEHCKQNDAEYILRMRKNSFTIRNEQGELIDLLEAFRNTVSDGYADVQAFATNLSGDKVSIRICAKKKDPEAIIQTQKRLKRKESKRQLKISDEAKVFNEYIVVVTNLNGYISAEDILEAYRLRWQVEIYFKRLKSILNFGELPKRRPDSVIAWLNGKLMIALLIEILLSKTPFPPKEGSGQEYLA
ncbi:IS4 family transposase [Sporomusa sp.]|uniref:IS4 family transposase n=1 Tax=Sporomusa sp. TaxID=2078658 RepID=UPI002C922996|nr:IS4 family transposase [Sporomusa sp.]HWR08318.1 IS4 family transposase [Sporomusa sp.]